MIGKVFRVFINNVMTSLKQYASKILRDANSHKTRFTFTLKGHPMKPKRQIKWKI
jgi:hypothetical protein